MRSHLRVPIVVIGLLLFGHAIVLPADTTVFEQLSGHYEAIRQALVHDNTDGVAKNAAAMEAAARDLLANFDAANAGVPADRSADCKSNLSALVEAAARLGDTGTLASARDAFFELSKPMVGYRQMVGSTDTLVVYCPMAEKAWMQPEGEIGNPYYGQSMARCGQVVSE